jgi:hypothetical protein
MQRQGIMDFFFFFFFAKLLKCNSEILHIMIITAITIYNCGTHNGCKAVMLFHVSSYHFVFNSFYTVKKTYIQTSRSSAVFICI